MTTRAAHAWPVARFGELRRAGFPTGVVLAVVFAIPPLSGLARRYELVEALQFSVYAMVVPALVVLAAPWGWSAPERGRARALADRLATARERHREPLRSALFLGLFIGVAILWRTPGAVDAIERHPSLLSAEAVSLLVVGAAFWLELVESGQLRPRSGPPLRGVLAAVAMWAVWTVSYLSGFSSTSWYAGFRHVIGHGLSAAADQQFSTGVLWLVAAVFFMPVVFWNLLAWLRSEESIDNGLERSAIGPKPTA